MGLAVDLHEHLVEMPLPLRDLAHVARSAGTDLAGEDRAEAMAPQPHALKANADAALTQEVFDIAK